MPRDRQPAGSCPKCGGNALTCTYNRFEKDELRIDSWEHKCPDCGYRDTTAFRSDDSSLDPTADPLQCPYCDRAAG